MNEPEKNLEVGQESPSEQAPLIDDGAIAKRESDGGDLHINLLDESAAFLEFGVYSPVFIGGGFVEGPAN